MLTEAELKAAIRAACEKHSVPSASVAILDGGKAVAAADGVLRVGREGSVGPETIYEIRSVSKLFAAAILMRLQDQGLVDLVAPIAEVFARGGHELTGDAKKIRASHLLSHSAGLEADYLAENTGENALETYVDQSLALPVLFEPGQFYSYSNMGTIWAGRLAEIVTGKSWSQLLQDLIVDPLSLSALSLFPYGEMSTPDIASGHVIGGDGTLYPVAKPGTPRSIAPAGGIIATALDVAKFGRALAEVSDDKDAFLSRRTAERSQKVWSRSPNQWYGTEAQGLGWTLDFLADGETLLGIDGGGYDQGSFLRVVPSRDLAVAVLTNGGGAGAFAADLLAAIYAAHGIERQRKREWLPEYTPLELDLRGGTYRRDGWTLTVAATENDSLAGTIVLDGSLAEILHNAPDKGAPLRPDPIVDGLYAAPLGRFGAPASAVFFRNPATGEPFLHMIGRAARRVQS